MPLILNIGRRIEATGAMLPVDTVYAALAAAGLDVLSSSHVASDTEPTIVVEVASWADYGIDAAQARAIARVSAALDQECIAVHDEDSHAGLLLGPRAHAWGDFNPDFFFGLDGRRLTERLPLAA